MSDPVRLDIATREAIVAIYNQVLVSTASIWEISIKQAQGRLEFPMDLFEATMRDMGFDILPILAAHAIAAGALPRHHSDPFDRMLVAQARLEHLVLVTRDSAMAAYDVQRLGSLSS